jgi:hypothetical protein
MGEASDPALAPAPDRNGLVSGGRPWSRPRPRITMTWGSAQADRSFIARFSSAAPRRGRRSSVNDRKATAAVMRCGCWRGELFEGCEPRRGERPGGPEKPGLQVARVGSRRETRRTPRSAAGCNKPATAVRRKPSRWCETTRAERESTGGTVGPNGISGSRGVDARSACRRRGEVKAPGEEGSTRRSRLARDPGYRASAGSSANGTRCPRRRLAAGGEAHDRSSRAPTGDGRRPGGRGKGQRPAIVRDAEHSSGNFSMAPEP